MKACLVVSTSNLHPSQRLSCITLCFRKFILVGSMLWQARHAKCLVLCGRGRSYNLFQNCRPRPIFELAPLLGCNESLVAIAYALQTLNFPFAHTSLSSRRQELRGMLCMMSISYGRNKAAKTSDFYMTFSWSMSCPTSVSG